MKLGEEMRMLVPYIVDVTGFCLKDVLFPFFHFTP